MYMYLYILYMMRDCNEKHLSQRILLARALAQLRARGFSLTFSAHIHTQTRARAQSR